MLPRMRQQRQQQQRGQQRGQQQGQRQGGQRARGPRRHVMRCACLPRRAWGRGARRSWARSRGCTRAWGAWLRARTGGRRGWARCRAGRAWRRRWRSGAGAAGRRWRRRGSWCVGVAGRGVAWRAAPCCPRACCLPASTLPSRLCQCTACLPASAPPSQTPGRAAACALQAYLGGLVLSPAHLSAANSMLADALARLRLQSHAHAAQLQLGPALSGSEPGSEDMDAQACGAAADGQAVARQRGTGAGAAAGEAWAEDEGWAEGVDGRGWGGVDVARLAHADLLAGSAGLTEAGGAAAAVVPAAAAAVAAQAGVNAVDGAVRGGVLCTRTMHAPGTWPCVLSAATLMRGALHGHAEHDAALLAHAAAACLARACALHAAVGGGPLLGAAPTAAPAVVGALGGCGLPAPQRQLHAWLPPALLGALLHGGSGALHGVPGEAGACAPDGPTAVVGLHWVAWAAARLMVERCSGGEGDAEARVQWARELADQAQVRRLL